MTRRNVEKAAFLYKKGLSTEEIAAVLDVSKETVRRLLWEARRRGLLESQKTQGEAPACEALAARLEAVISRLEALAAKLEAVVSRLGPEADKPAPPKIVDNEWVRILRGRG